ncbi:MAG TPA: class I SAM-dependent methyltransferase, partial [Anaerolineales bacterium]
VDNSPKMLAFLQEKLQRSGFRADVRCMDVCELDLGKTFDLILIPFHSFAHIVSVDDQRRVLDRIRQHLTPGGRFICTLGNPAIRRQAVDGVLRLVTKNALPGGKGTLLLLILEEFDPVDDHIVQAMEFFEEYDFEGKLLSKRLMELRFRLSSKDEFEELARLAGFQVQALYGDYARAPFDESSSPYMIWLLSKDSDR